MSKEGTPNVGRPERNPANKAIIMQAAGGLPMGGAYRSDPDPVQDAMAANIEELARNNRVIYSGGLADGQALVGRQGVYSVQVLRPLYVTPFGIAINLYDPVFTLNTPPQLHDLLGVRHEDTLTGTVVRGDVVVGNATPKWARLAVAGTAELPLFLCGDGTDAQWADAKVRVSNQDTTANYLTSKITADNEWIAATNTPAPPADQVIRMDHIGPGPEAYSIEWNECDEQGNFRAKLTASLDAVGHVRSFKGDGPIKP